MENTFYDYGKPEGVDGEKLLDLMDEGHTPVSLWALTNLDVNENDEILDIGCGSGLNLKRLHEKSSKAPSFGIDHSTTSVRKSILMNRKDVDEGNIVVEEGNVLDMPFEDEQFNIITAFETVYFWPQIVNSFKEVKRVLKKDGVFFLVFETNGCANEGYEKIANEQGCIFYNENQLKDFLFEAGYEKVTIYLRNRKDNKKVIRKITSVDCTQEIVEDNFEGDNYLDELKSEKYTPSSEWMCILAQK